MNNWLSEPVVTTGYQPDRAKKNEVNNLTDCVDNVDDEKGTPAEQKDSHNDAHLIG